MSPMTKHWSKMSRASVAVSLAVTAVVVAVVASCSDSPSLATGENGTGPNAGSSCTTPQTGCPCTPGSVAACGHRVDGDLNFIYCYEGQRHCGPSGVYGECGEGSVVPMSLGGGLHTSGLGTPGACQGDTPGPLLVCTSGKRQGEYCTSALDCASGVKKCLGGANDGSSCKKEKDCADPGLCTSFNGTCTGGTRNGFGCDALADCPGGTACAPGGGGGTCGSYSGICDNGSSDGEACTSNADCPGGACESGHGHCQGGHENSKKCRHNKHCKGGASCSAENPGTPGIIDPCDPYCHVTSDTPAGLDAGAAFTLSDGGLSPAPGCGDGVLIPGEACDDGNTANGDGCSTGCKLEPGYQCPTPGSPCTLTTCGNGVQEGTEQCDDGNLRPYDGCSPGCLREVSCPAPTGATAAACVAICGDGIKFASEACDDGNLTDGDGCSSTCTVEPGATCTTINSPPAATLDVPVIYRDFTPTHPDFQSPAPHAPYVAGPCVGGATLCVGGQRRGIPTVTLAADKEPAFNTTQGCVGDATTFAQWYHDVPSVNRVILGNYLRLRNISGSYVFDSSADPAYNDPTINCGNATPTTTCNSLSGFYPLNGKGFGNYASTGRNYHFTSEVRYPFTYAGGEVLSFTGDDDVFVYIGGKKVVDLGGIHAAEPGSVTLGAATNTVPASSPIGLVVGNTYEISVFQAERNTTGSNYKLTLQGFTRKISSCTVPPPPQTFVRDYEGVCGAGESVVWQLFRWKAGVPTGTSIDFRAATAPSQAALPASPPAAAPTTVPVGTATPANSPASGPLAWTYDTVPGPTPVPVSQHLQVEGLGTKSQRWLRVYMTFNGAPTLYEWQQLYDCVPSE
jgi:fibro-slime domain-containing protein